MLYDTHCHPYLSKHTSQEALLENFFASWWTYLNSIATDIESSETCIQLAKKNTWVKAVIGIHPCEVLQYHKNIDNTLKVLEQLYQKNKKYIVAIWESGLDYHWLNSLSDESGMSKNEIIDIQKNFFCAHITLAKKLDLPLVIHNRNAAEDIFDILKNMNYANFVFHCYSENLTFAKKLIDFAPQCKIAFGGILTFKNAKDIQETARTIPLRHIMVETDAPYLTPEPYRGKQENHPGFTQYVLEKLIELRTEKAEEVKQTVYKNSISCFSP